MKYFAEFIYVLLFPYFILCKQGWDGTSTGGIINEVNHYNPVHICNYSILLRRV